MTRNTHEHTHGHEYTHTSKPQITNINTPVHTRTHSHSPTHEHTQNYDLELAVPASEVGMSTGATIHTEKGLPVRLTRRTN